MIVTEADLRDQVRRPTPGARVVIPDGARLSPSAADFIKQWQLVVDAEAPVTAPVAAAARVPDEWDKPSNFPVQLQGELPRCTSCGTEVQHKADALTQLNAHHYVVKNHPRIKLRGRVDSLHALVLMTQNRAIAAGETWLADNLGTMAAYCRELTSAEYNERPVAELALPGADAEQIHQATHDPQGAIGIAHLTISGADAELQHWLNMGRTMSREIELTAIDAFGHSPHDPSGSSICHALNRLSSAFYYLQLRLTKESQS